MVEANSPPAIASPTIQRRIGCLLLGCGRRLCAPPAQRACCRHACCATRWNWTRRSTGGKCIGGYVLLARFDPGNWRLRYATEPRPVCKSVQDPAESPTPTDVADAGTQAPCCTTTRADAISVRAAPTICRCPRKLTQPTE